MKIQFYLRFHTQNGQNLFITGNTSELGNAEVDKAYPLQFINHEFWMATVETDPAANPKIQYNYLLKNADGTIVMEWGDDRIIDISKSGVEEIQTIDTWNHAGEFENVFFTSPFKQTLLKHHKKAGRQKATKHFTHIFKVKAPLLKKSEALCICGSNAALGEWSAESPLLMTLQDNWWVTKVELPKESFPVAYKYGVFSTKEKTFRHFENGNNRILYGDAVQNKISIIHDGFAQLPNNTWRGAGLAIPVFSLRSKDSFGVGEFCDLRLLVDWASKTGLKLIQLLPVN